MKVTTDGCLFGAWVSEKIKNEKLVINNALDIGTGTGLLSLMFAQKNPFVKIDAIEVDNDAAIQAEENAANVSFKNSVRIIHDDARSYSFPHKYDLIISNPPFYENELKGDSPKKNTAHHNEGMLLIELLAIIKNNLKPDGRFCLLLPYKRHEEIKRLFSKNDLDILQMTFVKQSVNHDYFRILLIGKLSSDLPVKTEFNELSIRDERQQYTTEFAELLKDYYLYL